MLQLYDYIEQMLRDAQLRARARTYPYFASDVLLEIGCEKEEDMEMALRRAFQACRALNEPISDNFLRVFRYNGEKLVTDWELSSLGCYLLVINGNPCHPSVARAQIYIRQTV